MIEDFPTGESCFIDANILGHLTNDAMIVALMRRHQLSHLITNDDDFDAVPGLTIWKPR